MVIVVILIGNNGCVPSDHLSTSGPSSETIILNEASNQATNMRTILLVSDWIHLMNLF